MKAKLEDLPQHYIDAVGEASVICDDDYIANYVIIKTYRTKDIQRMVEKVWGWTCRIDRRLQPHDAERVCLIARRWQMGEPRWPYISLFASTMKELMKTEKEDNGDISVPNHGDGWHRLIAAVAEKKPTVEILFFC
jgi:hypothetical protein